MKYNGNVRSAFITAYKTSKHTMWTYRVQNKTFMLIIRYSRFKHRFLISRILAISELFDLKRCSVTKLIFNRFYHFEKVYLKSVSRDIWHYTYPWWITRNCLFRICRTSYRNVGDGARWNIFKLKSRVSLGEFSKWNKRVFLNTRYISDS